MFFSAPLQAAALDPYEVIDNLVPKAQLPRVLNTEDVPDLGIIDPSPLQPTSGDFDVDGIEDIAIAGIYGLPKGARYFLVVGTLLKEPVRYKALYFQTYDSPVFIHRPGTTGEGDPRNQAFSISFCFDCSNGYDFFWQSKKREFTIVKWKAARRQEPMSKSTPIPDVPDEIVDQALRIVGKLKDVQSFTAQGKKRGSQISVRARYEPSNQGLVWVTILDRRDRKETTYDEILVDVGRKAIIRRTKRRHRLAAPAASDSAQ